MKNRETPEALMLNLPVFDFDFDFGNIKRPKTAFECIALGCRFLIAQALHSEVEFTKLIKENRLIKYEVEFHMKLAKRFGLGEIVLVDAAGSVEKLYCLNALNEVELSEILKGGQVCGISLKTLPRMTYRKLRDAMDARYIANRRPLFPI